MSETDHHTLNKFLLKATASVRLYVDMAVDAALLSELLRGVKRGIATDLLIAERQVEAIESDPFLLNRLLQLRKHGASIYQVSSFEGVLVCQADFERMLYIGNDNRTEYLQKDDPRFINLDRLFTETDRTGAEYRSDQNDIIFSLAAENLTIVAGDTTRLHWSTTHADHVEIDRFGHVPLAGSQDIAPVQDTIIKVIASNREQTKIKCLKVQVLNQLSIDYDVQFFNVASRQYVSLKDEENYDGVFGIARGTRVKLCWQVEECDELTIDLFNITDLKSGEHIFTPEGTIEINIRARLRQQTRHQRIIIHEFPMPVFSEKFVHINDEFQATVIAGLKDYRQQAAEFLKEKGLLYEEEFTADLRKRIKSREKGLQEIYRKVEFQSFYKDHSITKLNKLIRNRLMHFFGNKPEIAKAIDSLHHE